MAETESKEAKTPNLNGPIIHLLQVQCCVLRKRRLCTGADFKVCTDVAFPPLGGTHGQKLIGSWLRGQSGLLLCKFHSSWLDNPEICQIRTFGDALQLKKKLSFLAGGRFMVAGSSRSTAHTSSLARPGLHQGPDRRGLVLLEGSLTGAVPEIWAVEAVGRHCLLLVVVCYDSHG